jgi:tRNA threonylcarbamoyladenosine biosynthesis protein TsaE
MTIVGKNYAFELLSLEDCHHIAQQLKSAIKPLEVLSNSLHIWLCGDLGSGKTTFTRYFLQSFGHQGKVKSPTYNLCESYPISDSGSQLAIHHFDLYRMNHPREWEEAGFKDILTSPGITLIEWPEKASGTLPAPDLILRLHYVSENHRNGSFEAHSSEGAAILDTFSI